MWGRKSESSINTCTTIPRYLIFSKRYSVMCKVYTGYHGTSEIEHGLCSCSVDISPYRHTNHALTLMLAKARGLSLHIDAKTMLYFSINVLEVRESEYI